MAFRRAYQRIAAVMTLCAALLLTATGCPNKQGVTQAEQAELPVAEGRVGEQEVRTPMERDIPERGEPVDPPPAEEDRPLPRPTRNPFDGRGDPTPNWAETFWDYSSP